MSTGLLPPPAAPSRVIERLQAHGFQAWLVGGCVRDRLLGRAVGDWDVTTDALPEQVVRIFPKVIPTGLQHGTVTVVERTTQEAEVACEVTTFRVERGYTDGRHPDQIAFTRELPDDLSRRDFTVNAIAWDPRADVVVDPFGGREDLARRRLRAVGSALDRFGEDGLRALRAVRFATVLDFAIDPETFAAIPATLDTFRRVSAERVRVELGKTLLAPRASWGVAALHESGLLGVFLPELAGAAEGARQAAEASVGRLSPDLPLRLSAWLRPVPSVEALLARLTFSRQEQRATAHLHARLREGVPAAARNGEPEALWGLAAQLGAADLERPAAWGAALADGGPWSEVASRFEALDVRRGPLTVKDLALDGRAVMEILGIPPSPRLKAVLEGLLRAVWRAEAPNTEAGLRGLLARSAGSPDADVEVP